MVISVRRKWRMLTMILVTMCGGYWVIFDQLGAKQLKPDLVKPRNKEFVGENLKVDKLINKPYPAVYTSPAASGINKTGKSFDVNLSKQPETFIDINQFDLTNFTFVTGVSSNHFNESIDMIAGIQEQFPEKKIILYDLRLTAAQRKQVSKWCNVIFREFQFKKYPKHVANLHTYAFKPIIIRETLMEFGAVFWADASVRQPRIRRDWSVAYDVVKSSGGIAVLTKTYVNITRTTLPAMYAYLPSNVTRLQTTMQNGGGVLLIYNTKFVYENILRWLYMCALTADCICPSGHKLKCVWTDAPPPKPVCHRYDQSALSILTSNLYGYDGSRYVPRGPRIVDVNRTATSEYELRNTSCSARL